MTKDEGRKTNGDSLPSFVDRPSSVLVIGLGNPILGDDGVGWRVAEEVKRRLGIVDFGSQSAVKNPQSAIEVDCVSLGGLSLM